MAAPLFGVETEYAFAALDRAGRSVDRGRALRRLFALVGERHAHLPDSVGAGVFLGNASRLYLDHGQHPELSTPECGNPWDAVRYVLAGDRILTDAVETMARDATDPVRIVLSRCNVDYVARTTWGAHESYLHRVNPKYLSAQLVPHLVSRLVFTGAGGFDNLAHGASFTLSPRVPHLQRVVSSDSTSGRGIFHTKNEPLCRGGYGRLHVLCGESNASETAAWLKIGTTALIVALIDAGDTPAAGIDLASPVAAMRTFAGDPQCKRRAATQGGQITALQIQRQYLTACEARRGAPFFPEWADEVCRLWRSVLERLEADPRSLATTLDWAIKHELLRAHAERRGIAWDDLVLWSTALDRLTTALRRSASEEHALTPELLRHPQSPIKKTIDAMQPLLRRRGIDLREIEPILALRRELCEIDVRFTALGDGIFAALDGAGALDHHVPGVDRIEEAVLNPPAGGRAAVRGGAIQRLAARRGEPHAMADWSGIWDDVEKRQLDLSDPFASEAQWTPRMADSEPEALFTRVRRSMMALLER